MTNATSQSIVAVSGCLLGIRCRYDGRSKRAEGLLERLAGVTIIPVCPEELGGLPTPRPLAQFDVGDGRAVLAGSARLINAEGLDVTSSYVEGASEVLRICKLLKIRTAYLKEKSPACGVHHVTIDGELTAGMGVTSAMLEREGVELESVG